MNNPDVALLLDAAETELRSLEEEIGRLQSLVDRRDQLRSFLHMGRSLYGEAGAERSEPSVAAGIGSRTVPEGMSPFAGRLQIRKAARRIIEAEGPTRTKDLIGKLEAQGLEIRGRNKVDTLSVILSRAKEFKADRAAGWSVLQDAAASPASGYLTQPSELHTSAEDTTPAM